MVSAGGLGGAVGTTLPAEQPVLATVGVVVSGRQTRARQRDRTSRYAYVDFFHKKSTVVRVWEPTHH